MRWKLPRPQFRLSKLAGLVALSAVAMWAGMYFLSPTRRLTRQIQPGQPAYLRREATMNLGYVPFWEAEEAIDVLVGALNDPSPRVRESALSGLGAHGARAGRVIPAILRSLGDKDRGVRYSACAVLGIVHLSSSRGPEHEAVVAALKNALDDDDLQNRLAAAVSLLRLGETAAAIPTIAMAATDAADEYLRPRARQYIERYGTIADLIAGVVPLVSAENQGRRQGALDLLFEIAPVATVTAALHGALEEGTPEVRRWAAKKLESLAPEWEKSAKKGEPAVGVSVPIN